MMLRKNRTMIAAFLTVLSLLTLGTSAVLASPAAQDEEGGGQSSYCANAEPQHPVAAKIAEKYGVAYEQVMAWRCEAHFGFGEIVLALQTSALTGKTPEELLGQHGEGHAWGQIWKENGLTKNDKDGGPPEWAGQGRPPWAGSEHGKPCWAGVGNGTLPEGCVKPGNKHGNGNGNGNGGKPCWAGVGNGPLPEGCAKPGNKHGNGNGNGNGNKPCWAGVGNNPLPPGCVKPTDTDDEGDEAEVTQTPTP